MNLLLAFKAFFKALKDGNSAQLFLEEKQAKPQEKDGGEHIRLLMLLQQEGRLVDFLKEDLTGFTDQQIGGAVRKIHQDCSKTLEEFVTPRPLLQEAEGASITIPQGYDSGAIKIVGQVKGMPPYRGIVRHRGWKAHKLSLPKHIQPSDPTIINPAEVEIV
jgi:hypothetical protein